MFVQCDKLVRTLLSKLEQQHSTSTYTETLQSLLHYATHHLVPVINTLLAQPLPFAQLVPGCCALLTNVLLCIICCRPVVDCLHTLSRNSKLLTPIMEHLMMALMNVISHHMNNQMALMYDWHVLVHSHSLLL